MNTAKAGAGALAVTIDGPSKVQLSCYETPDGYEFMYTPTQPGEYHVNVKYAGNTHIPGSPFKVDIEGKGGAVNLCFFKITYYHGNCYYLYYYCKCIY